MAKKYSEYNAPYKDKYPRARRNRYRRRYSRSAKIRRVKQSIGGVLAFVLLIAVGFFVTSTFMDISKKPVQITSAPTAQGEAPSKVPATEPPAKQIDSAAALYMPDKFLHNPSSMQAFLTNAKALGADSVMIDFKRADGTIVYASPLESVIKVGSIENNVEDINAVIKTIHDSGLKVIAKIYCYRDPLAPYRLGTQSYVHYKNTASSWIDNAIDKGGKRWLNPYSDEAQDYLLDIIGEVAAMDVDRIILDSVQFPEGYGLSSATYPGEKESGKTRNQILKSFISKASRAVGDVPMAVTMTANGALNGDADFYGGTLIDSKDSLYAPDLRLSKLKGSIKIGAEDIPAPKADPVSFISKASAQLKGKAPQLIPIVEASPTLPDQIKALNAAGIKSYVVYNEQGNYTKLK